MEEPVLDSKTIRVGIIGAGANTRLMHIPKLQQIEGVEISSVCNQTQASGERVAKEFNIPQVETDWQALVADPDLDAVVIGTWPNTHCKMTCAALEHGKHVLCEARMAMNAEEGQQMLETSRAHPNLMAQIVPAPFTLKWDGVIQRLMLEGYLGQLYSVEVRGCTGDFNDPTAAATWRQKFSYSGNNTLLMGIWYEAVSRWVGPARSVFAQTRVFTPRRPNSDGGDLEISIPDHVDCIAELNKGAVMRMQFSAVTGHANDPMSAWLYGSDGTLHLDARNNTLRGIQKGDVGFSTIEPLPGEEGTWQVEEDFIRSIRQRDPVEHTSLEDALKYMQFTDAVHASELCGQKILISKSP